MQRLANVSADRLMYKSHGIFVPSHADCAHHPTFLPTSRALLVLLPCVLPLQLIEARQVV